MDIQHRPLPSTVWSGPASSRIRRFAAWRRSTMSDQLKMGMVLLFCPFPVGVVVAIVRRDLATGLVAPSFGLGAIFLFLFTPVAILNSFRRHRRQP